MKTDVRPLRLEDLAKQVREFEVRYGVPSDRMHELFEDGEPSPTLRKWSLLYRTLESARRAAARRSER